MHPEPLRIIDAPDSEASEEDEEDEDEENEDDDYLIQSRKSV